MCAIIGSRSVEKLKELVSLNSYRGSHSYSLSTFSTYTGILTIHKKKLGTIELDNYTLAPNEYAIVHIQAPTTDARTHEFIHPAIISLGSQTESNPDLALWHNGIIKAETVKDNVDNYLSSWDTMQILRALFQANSFSVLNEFDGTFSCLMYNRADLSLKLFRNEISPMFIDDDLNISSTKFPGSRETIANHVIKLNFKNNSVILEDEFKTVENPYYFGE
jgi:hypothetical protein